MASSQPPVAPAAKGKRYTALSAIDHDGKRYEEGRSIVLDDEAAVPLLAGKAIALAGKGSEEGAE